MTQPEGTRWGRGVRNGGVLHLNRSHHHDKERKKKNGRKSREGGNPRKVFGRLRCASVGI